MATLREYLDKDFSRLMSFNGGLELKLPEGPIRLDPRVHSDDEANATFLSCYLPENVHTAEICRVLIDAVDIILASSKGLQITSGVAGQDHEDFTDSTTNQFTGRFFFYCEDSLPSEVRREIRSAAKAKGIHVVFRGPDYATARASHEKPLAFISHDSRDKDAIARPLALGLSKRICPVWYDEYSLKVGARLRESIEAGLKECPKCILIITPNFLTNSGWTKAEFNSVFTREILERQDVILPIWHHVTAKDVYEYSPSLADRVALNWKEGEDAVVDKIHRAIVRAG
jgi:hypothetical protein